MKKLILALASLLCISGSVVGVATSSAHSAGCGPEQFTNSTTGNVAGDNLKVAGRPLRWTFAVYSRDCDGYDLITGVSAGLSKTSGGCQAALGYTDGYKFNPNALGGVNGGEKWVNCIASAGDYGVTYPSYEGVHLTSGMSSAARCLNFTFTVDIQAQADPSWDNAAPICFNGL
jgi:hypothetical protein